MTLVPGTVYDPDILLGNNFVPNIIWRPETLIDRKRVVEHNALFFCSFLELNRIKTLAIGKQLYLADCIKTEIGRRSGLIERNYCEPIDIYYGYYFYNALTSDLRLLDHEDVRHIKTSMPDSFYPIYRIFINKYRPFTVPMYAHIAAKRLGKKLDDRGKLADDDNQK